jgi:monoamine oxidase
LGLRTEDLNDQDDTLLRLTDGSALAVSFETNRFPDLRLMPEFTWQTPKEPDESLASYLLRTGISASQLEYEPRIFAIDEGAPLHDLSAAAALERLEDETEGEGDYAVLDGYDCLPKFLAQGLEVRLEHVVSQVEYDSSGVSLTLESGESLRGEAVIVTVPLGILKTDKPEFSPPLPPNKLEAIRAIGFSPMLKLMYTFSEPIFPRGITYVYGRGNPPCWWSSSLIHEHASSFNVTGFVTGDWAQELLHLVSDQAMLEYGLHTLRTDLRRAKLEPTRMLVKNWSADPFSLGGYSFTPVHAAKAREVLAQSVQNRVFFAGEATASNAHAGSVHGAFSSGERVAQELLMVLGK